MKHLKSCRDHSFNAMFSKSHFSPQYFYVTLEEYKVDHVLHQENLNKEAKDIDIHIKYDYSKTISTKNIKPMDTYNEKMKDVVYNLYKEDFKLFGYNK
tara:strand:- start:350 stop:643 length:294 start_codon:yes stop_codon:yes gene_type:complete